MSDKKQWSEEELRIIGEVFLEHPNTKKSTCEEAAKRLKEAGYGDIPLEKIKPQLGDFLGVHNKRKRNHSKTAERIYNELFEKTKRIMNGIGAYIFEVYGKNSPIIDYDTEFDLEDNSPAASNINFNTSKMDLFVVNNFPKTKKFVDFFMELCIKSGKDDRKIYNPSGKNGGELIDRRVFSKMKQGQSLSKANLVKFAICLHLDYDTTVELLAMANCAFNPGCQKDVIIMYAIQHGIYDPMEIDDTLYYYRQETLFW